MYIVIMAGGSGTRFWPRSRRALPKQLLTIAGRDTMLRQTAARVAPLAPPERTVVVTTQGQETEVRRQLPGLPAENILVEPVGRNTAPCIGFAATFISRKAPEAVMAALPADHAVSHTGRLRKVLRVARRRAAKGEELLTIGVLPTGEETGYGYIKRGEEVETSGQYTLHQVERFTEKPSQARARKFLSSGDYLWNSGMFICRVDTLLGMIEKHLPPLAAGLERIGRAMGGPSYRRALRKEYAVFPNISIDYGVAERERRVLVIPADLGWNDVGSWRAVLEVCKATEDGNVVTGRHVNIDSSGCVIHSPHKIVATVGIHDLIIVDTEDALLVCTADRAQEVREVVAEIERRGLREYI